MIYLVIFGIGFYVFIGVVVDCWFEFEIDSPILEPCEEYALVIFWPIVLVLMALRLLFVAIRSITSLIIKIIKWED